MKRRNDGRFTVTGPFEEDHPVPNVGAGISCGQTFATRHRAKADDEEMSYYVRDIIDSETHAIVTKHPDGVITTTLT